VSAQGVAGTRANQFCFRIFRAATELVPLSYACWAGAAEARRSYTR